MGAIGTVSGAWDTLSPGELLLPDVSAGGEESQSGASEGVGWIQAGGTMEYRSEPYDYL